MSVRSPIVFHLPTKSYWPVNQRVLLLYVRFKHLNNKNNACTNILAIVGFSLRVYFLVVTQFRSCDDSFGRLQFSSVCTYSHTISCVFVTNCTILQCPQWIIRWFELGGNKEINTLAECVCLLFWWYNTWHSRHSKQLALFRTRLYKTTHVGTQVAQWDFKNKATRKSPP